MHIFRIRRLLLGTAALGAIVIAGAGPVLASPHASSGGAAKDGYNAIPSKISGNVPSLGFQATQTNEFGDEVTLGGTARRLQSMSVVLSSWACETGHWTSGDCETTPGATFDVPVTFTVYADANGAAGAVLAQQTQTVAVAYRPSTSSLCTGGKWYNSKDRTCYSGIVQTVQMTFDGQTTLPDDVIWTVAYSTSGYGPAPHGYSQPCNSDPAGCPYDSLNVGVWSAPNAPYAGTDVNEDEAFRNGALEAGWTGYRPLGAIVTT
jgi:hypothetical protein